MSRINPVAALLALVTLPVMASAADDVGALRAELQSMKSEYDARVQKLEARIQQLESANAAAADAAAAMPAAESAPPALPPPASGGGASAFNPSISVVLGGSYTSASRDPADWAIAGFTPAGDEIGPGDRSFNLGESEMTIAASVDPYFSAQLTAAIAGEGEIGVEEAFVRTSALPDGFTAKLGRFFSGLGYLNEVHAHAWDFVDQPLAYQALFGGQFTQNGVQLKWIAPTDLFLEFGAETGNGDSFPGTHRDRNGLNGATLFAHWAVTSATMRAGAPARPGRRRMRNGRNEFVDPLLDGFTGDSRTWVADAVFKWRAVAAAAAESCRRNTCAATSVACSRSIHCRSRCRWRTTTRRRAGTCKASINSPPRWRAGVRYDRLDSGTPALPSAGSERRGLRSLPLAAPGAGVLDGRLEPQRVHALARSTTWMTRGMTVNEIACSACNTSSASARMARTSTRTPT